MGITGNCDLFDEEVSTFLASYRLSRTQLYQGLMELTKEKCEELLKSISIKGVVGGRTKDKDSLERKLKGLEKDPDTDLNKPTQPIPLPPQQQQQKRAQPSLPMSSRQRLAKQQQSAPSPPRPQKQVPTPQAAPTGAGAAAEDDWQPTETSAAPGPSVTTNTPDFKKDPKKVPSKVPTFRDWVLEGKKIHGHPDMGDLAGVRIGLYFPDDVIKVTKEVRKRFNVIHLFGTVTGERDITKDRNLDVDKHLDGPWHDGNGDHWEHYGYKSWQMVVEWKESPREDLNSLRVEIQIGTVVTQAWAEVQHNIIYKEPADIRCTPNMKRMIDAINGLAITTDVILRELERSLEHAKKEAKVRGRQSFKDGNEFSEWFELTYLRQMWPEEHRRWVYPPAFAHVLVSYFGGPTPLGPTLCRNDFKKVIDYFGLLQPKTETVQSLDISFILLEILGPHWNVLDEPDNPLWIGGRPTISCASQSDECSCHDHERDSNWVLNTLSALTTKGN